MRIIEGEAWVEEDFVSVVFIKAKDIDFNKDKYEDALKEYDDILMIDSKIEEGYMRYNVGYHHDYGKGFWQGCSKGDRGASLFYYAKTKLKN